MHVVGAQQYFVKERASQEPVVANEGNDIEV